ncbi:MAG: branched-chain amino acid ABC transporter substrate-binding protein [Desulfobulbaceae bacterium]|nr:branched-chain amino acid ABC transporter substrate-binding protein [Desulfobulbaceae bacterium]
MAKSGKIFPVLASAALLVASVSPSFAAAPIKIGVAGAHSGDLASYGLPTLKGAELVVKDVNAKGGIKGELVELVLVDEQCKPEAAANVATKLVSDNVKAVIGHTCSGPTKAALPIYRDAGIVAISPSATTPELTQSGEYKYFFRTIASDDRQARTMTDFVLEKLAPKKIAILHDKGDYGLGLATYARKFIGESGKAEVVLFEGITVGQVDFSAVIQKIKRSGAEVVIFGGYHPEASKLVSQMRKKRLDAIFVSDDGAKDEAFIKVAGKDAEGVYATGPTDTTKNPLTIEYREKFKKAEGADPGSFFDNGIAATLAIINALDKAKSFTADDVATALRSEKVDTPFGEISFDEHGDPVGIGFNMFVVKDGQYVTAE